MYLFNPLFTHWFLFHFNASFWYLLLYNSNDHVSREQTFGTGSYRHKGAHTQTHTHTHTELYILPKHLYPRREAGDVWCLPPVWNLRAVIWFYFTVASLALLPSPVTLFLSYLFFCLLTQSSGFFPPENSSVFFIKWWLFCMAPV